MNFHAPKVSGSVAGDYYQLDFGPEETLEDTADPFSVRGPYLMIQRQFEMFDGGRCHIESDNESYIGDFHLELIELTPMRLSFEIHRKCNSHVNVTFVVDSSEFEHVRSVAEVIFGLKEPGHEELQQFSQPGVKTATRSAGG